MFPVQTPSKELAPTYLAMMAAWRNQQQNDLCAPEGWLAVVGLHWLEQGANTVGTDASCSIRLSNLPAPQRLGTFTLHDNNVSFEASASSTVTKDGIAFPKGEIRPDQDRLREGRMTYVTIKRGSRIGIRIFDPGCTAKRQFSGMHWFPIEPAYKVQAKFTPYLGSRTLSIVNVVGDTSLSPTPGYVTFTLRGKPCRLEAQSEGSGLFLNFTDSTSGTTTYPAGRFLYTAAPIAGQVEIDFNKAVNPPCAFTAFATCPLPPKGNRLDVAVEAGEKTHHPGT